MKLVTSTGDFSQYKSLIPDKVRLFKDTKFKYINLEQTGQVLPELFRKTTTIGRDLPTLAAKPPFMRE